jgi:hypothetical protein
MRRTAAALAVSAASICWWLKRLHPLPTHKSTPESQRAREALRQYVSRCIHEDPSLTHNDIVLAVRESLGLRVSRHLIASILAACGYTRKKLRPRVSPRDPEIAREFSRRLLSLDHGGVVVSIDESGFDCRVRPVFGYSKKGQRATAAFPYTSDRTMHNLVMGVASNGQSHHSFLDHRVTGQHFASFIAQLPFPSGHCYLTMQPYTRPSRSRMPYCPRVTSLCTHPHTPQNSTLSSIALEP